MLSQYHYRTLRASYYGAEWGREVEEPKTERWYYKDGELVKWEAITQREWKRRMRDQGWRGYCGRARDT